MKVVLGNSVSQLDNSKKSLMSRINQVSGVKYKVRDIDKIRTELKKNNAAHTGKEHTRNVGTLNKAKPLN